jgi:hypothetical protein
MCAMLLVRLMAMSCYDKTGIMDLMDLGLMHCAMEEHLCNTGAHKSEELTFDSASCPGKTFV